MISSLNNAAVKATVRLKKRRERERRGAFLVEGRRAVGAALEAGVRLHELFYVKNGTTMTGEVVDRATRRGASVREVSPAVMAHLTQLGHPPGVVAVAPWRPATLAQAAAGEFVVVLCGIHDPRVAGGVLATAAGAGATGAVSTASTTDVFAPAAVRTASGAHFVIPVAAEPDPAAVAGALGRHRWVAVSDEGSPVDSESMERPLALFVCEAGVPEVFDAARRVCVATTPGGVGPGIGAAAAVVLYRAGGS